MSSSIFASLREQLTQGRVLLPGDEGYEDSLKRWSATCVKPAAAVAQPKTAQEASSIVKFANQHSIPFNVKGGGHSTSPSSCAPSPQGMVLDLSLMRNVTVDKPNQLASIDGGCTWRDVDDALWPHGLATVGGTVSHTGVGGLILHGGFGFLSGIHGLTIDILQSCEVVLADGSVVTASRTENEDLFWALRGAGSSFGVVTKFVTQAFPQGDIWAGHIVFLPDKLPQLVDFVNHWAANNDGKQGMAFCFSHAPPAPPAADAPAPNGDSAAAAGAAARPPVLILMVNHMGPDADTKGPEFFAPVLNLDGILLKQVGPCPYPAVNRGADDIFPPMGRYLMAGSNFTTPLKADQVEAFRQRFMAFSAEHPGTGSESSLAMFECLPNGKTRTVPASSAAFNSRGDYYNVLLSWSWEDPAVDGEVRTYSRQLMQNEIRKLGYHEEGMREGVGQYINYNSSGMEAEAAFGSHTDRLKSLKAKYDPNNVFDKLWKLSGSVKTEQWVPAA